LISQDGCSNTQNVVLNINPALVISNAAGSYEICSGNSFKFVPNANITNVPYLWTRAFIPGISSPTGSGSGNIDEILINSTDSPIEVQYIYRIGQAVTCASDQAVKVTVKPLPKLTGSKSIQVCSNAPVAYTPIANIQNKVYSILPCFYNSCDFSEKIKKYISEKNVVIEFILDIANNTLADFYITNTNTNTNTNINKNTDFVCAGCNVSIVLEESYCILKCCSQPYHFECLLKCYINDNSNIDIDIDIDIDSYPNVGCKNCGVCKNDIYSRNSSILIGIYT
jgi:hypothetical protein